MTTPAYTRLRDIVANAHAHHGQDRAIGVLLSDLSTLLDLVDRLQFSDAATREALGGFVHEPFDGSNAGGIAALSIRLGAAESAAHDAAAAHPSPTDPIDPDKWVARSAWEGACRNHRDACQERDAAKATEAAVLEHHWRAFQVLNPPGASHTISLTVLASLVMQRLNKAEESLTRAGYTDHGGAAWAPPLGPTPPHLLDLVKLMVDADDGQTGHNRCEYMLKPVLDSLGVVTL